MAGTEAVNRSQAWPGAASTRGSSAEFRVPSREYATGGVLATNSDAGRVDVDIAGTADGGLDDQRCCGSPKPASVLFLSDGWVSRDQLACLAW
jgi:hypothetical protein